MRTPSHQLGVEVKTGCAESGDSVDSSGGHRGRSERNHDHRMHGRWYADSTADDAAGGTPPARGHTAAGVTPDAGISGVLGVDSAGCVTVHGGTLLAPVGSEMRADGTIHLSGIGDYKIGDELPMMSGEVANASDVDSAYQGCESRQIAHVVAKE